MLSQSLQQKMQQKLSPLQIQLMKLIEVPAALLEQRIKEEMVNNPVLEVDGEREQGRTEDEEETPDAAPEEPEDRDATIEEYLKLEETPASSTARAMAEMSVTFGVSFTMTGF